MVSPFQALLPFADGREQLGRYLERQGLMERDAGNIFLTQEAVGASDEDPTNQLLGSSVTYRIAVGPQQGRKVFTLQTLPDAGSDNLSTTVVGEVSGFSLHAGVATRANEREKLERLCRYITRPPISTIDASWDWSSYSTLHPCALMDNGESPPLYDFIGEGSINYLAAVTIMADQSGDIIAGNITGGSVC